LVPRPPVKPTTLSTAGSAWTIAVARRSLALIAWTLDWALRHGVIVMLVLLGAVVLNVYLYVIVPKGFFPPCASAFRKRAHIIGVVVSETTREIRIASDSTTANSRATASPSTGRSATASS
jgi:hypothetical protein